MNRLFAETYAKDQEIEARYDAAELKNDQIAMEQARADHFALEASIQAQGKSFELLYSLYIPTTTCWPCATGRKSWRNAASTA